MQQLDAALETAMKRGYTVEGKLISIVEWNFNNTFETNVVNELDEANDTWLYTKDYFPPTSVVANIRPNSGIFYAQTNTSVTYDGDPVGAGVNRFYTLEKNNFYQYWVSPVESSYLAIGERQEMIIDGEYPIEKSRLRVDYVGAPKVNKIRVTFNIGPKPIDWVISVQDATTDVWSDIPGPYVIDEITGKCEMWWDGTSWSSTQNLSQSVFKSIKSIKVWIKTIDTANDRINIVEIAGCREMDITDRTISYKVNSSMDDADFIHPIGQMNSNDGSVSIDNSDLELSDINIASDFYGLLSGWSQWRFYIDYNLANYSGPSSYKMRIGTLYTNDWVQLNEYEYEIELFDIIKLLQTVKCPVIFMENISIAEIISTILDMLGIDTYNFENQDFDQTNIVKYFWSDGNETAFEIIKQLCFSYQCGLFTDEFGMIRLVTRNDIDQDTPPSWTFRGEEDGLDFPDIETLQKTYELTSNDVNIKYKKREAKVDNQDVTAKELTTEIWNSTDTIAIRAQGILRDIPESGLMVENPVGSGNYENASVWVTPQKVESWPFQGLVNIDGEVFKYEGKGVQMWNYDTRSFAESLAKNPEEKLKKDKEAYSRYLAKLANPGNVIGDPGIKFIPNQYTGRLEVIERDVEKTGSRFHTPAWQYGWFGLNGWILNPGSAAWPGTWFEPGGSNDNIEDLKNWKVRNGWNSAQNKWSWKGSVLTCDNVADGAARGDLMACLIRDLGDTEYREMGTRIKFNSGSSFGQAGIVFNLSNAVGYDTEHIIANPMNATRAYVLNVLTSDSVEQWGGGAVKEISIQVKNGNNATLLNTGPGSTGGSWKIDRDKWYDIDIVFRDGDGATAVYQEGGFTTFIDVYIDGQFVESFNTQDSIRPTQWGGLVVRQSSNVSFDYFYATNNSEFSRPSYANDDLFDMNVVQLKAGTNVETIINIPTDGSWLGSGVVSLASSASVQIHSLRLLGQPSDTSPYSNLPYLKQLGPISLSANSRIVYELSDQNRNTSAVAIKYTATEDMSLCYEYSLVNGFPYESDRFMIPPTMSFYDLVKGGYLSSKRDLLLNPSDGSTVNIDDGEISAPGRQIFFDDFGAVAHEMRKFDVDYDVAPAKGSRIYISNPKVRVLEENLGPSRGQFTLVNASSDDQIVNGTEEVNDGNSIDHTIMLYGYVLEEKGEETKNFQDKTSIRKRGVVTLDLEADWIFTDSEAENLGEWIVSNWADPMDTIKIKVFANSFSQIGDHVNVKYSNTNIADSYRYMITESFRSFDDSAFESTLTLRRIR